MNLDLGALQVQRVVELERLPAPASMILPQCTPELVARARQVLDERFIAADADILYFDFHSFVVRLPGLTVLIDTCNGNHKPRLGFAAYANHMATRYLDNLAALGLRPEDIDIVFCTHLHFDHIGWNTCLREGRWVPTFPRARYLFNRRELAYFDRLVTAMPDFPGIDSLEDSVKPILRSGLAEIIDLHNRHEIITGVWLEPAPGHTEGCAILRTDIGRNSTMFVGDVIHHPIQAVDPRLHVEPEFDSGLGIATRVRLLSECADTGALLFTGHFPVPSSTRVHRCGDGFALTFDSSQD